MSEEITKLMAEVAELRLIAAVLEKTYKPPRDASLAERAEQMLIAAVLEADNTIRKGHNMYEDESEPLMKRRRILEEIQIDKIAAVTSPAQEGAVACILKAAPKSLDDVVDTWSKHPFERAVDEIASTRKISKFAAQSIARREHPATFQDYQNTDVQTSRPIIRKTVPNEIVKAFGQVVESLMIAKRISRTEAMSLARIEAPDLFFKFQHASDE